MKKIILLITILSLVTGCTVSGNSKPSGKDTSYTLDSVNPR
jgi:hypothetical protein